jgi:hypothetical protein
VWSAPRKRVLRAFRGGVVIREGSLVRIGRSEGEIRAIPWTRAQQIVTSEHAAASLSMRRVAAFT